MDSFEVAVLENRFPAFDASEVVVYTDSHEGSFGTLAPRRAETLMWVWRDRYDQLGGRPDVDYVLIFENRGAVVGATLEHPHGQIHGYPFLPPVPAAERAADERAGGCAPAAWQPPSSSTASTVVLETDAFVAFIPYAARWPYEAHATLRTHRSSLLDCSAADLRCLADGLQRVARGYDALWDQVMPYMMVVHQAPTDGLGGGHVHVEFYPPLRAPDTPKHVASGAGCGDLHRRRASGTGGRRAACRDRACRLSPPPRCARSRRDA